MHFQSETSVFKFLRGSVDGALISNAHVHTDCIFFASRFMISSVFSSTCCCKSSRSRSNDFNVARISAVSKLCSAFFFSISSKTWKEYYCISNLFRLCNLCCSKPLFNFHFKSKSPVRTDKSFFVCFSRNH